VTENRNVPTEQIEGSRGKHPIHDAWMGGLSRVPETGRGARSAPNESKPMVCERGVVESPKKVGEVPSEE